MKAVVAAFNQEKALLVGAFSVITNLRMELFAALVASVRAAAVLPGEVGDDDWDRECDDQHAGQRAHPAHYLAQHRVGHHVPVPA